MKNSEGKEKDWELIEDLLLGQENALKKFYTQYSSRLRRFIIYRVRSNEDAEEVLQDTLLSAIESLALFSGKSRLFTWLCSIARHEVADYYRKRRIKTIVFSKMPSVSKFVSRALEPDAKLMRREYEAQVRITFK